ncbi:MAG TPA: hypothetical protein VFV99_08500 [Kofleriaceae bacterium]|nr:hypothetical protein [Kofleriaceae bacterium]
MRAMPNLDTFVTLDDDVLVTATGGQWQMRLPQPGSPGSGPMTLMSLLDKPGKTLDLVRQGLGMPESGPPGSTYIPATANPDGSVNRARLETPRDPNLPQVPLSQ